MEDRADADIYEIRVKGGLDQRWSRWFEGMEIAPLPGGDTLLVGRIVDQAALQGLLARIGDLGLTILLVRQIEKGKTEGEPR